jgi:hypothetical protein
MRYALIALVIPTIELALAAQLHDLNYSRRPQPPAKPPLSPANTGKFHEVVDL